MGDIQYELGLWIVSLFFLPKKSFYLCMPCRAHRFEGLCHGTNSSDLVPTTLYAGVIMWGESKSGIGTALIYGHFSKLIFIL